VKQKSLLRGRGWKPPFDAVRKMEKGILQKRRFEDVNLGVLDAFLTIASGEVTIKVLHTAEAWNRT
jgi:hypothetical protein